MSTTPRAEHTVFAVMTALMSRLRTGRGQFIDVSQTQTAAVTIPEILLDFSANGRAAAAHWQRRPGDGAPRLLSRAVARTGGLPLRWPTIPNGRDCAAFSEGRIGPRMPGSREPWALAEPGSRSTGQLDARPSQWDSQQSDDRIAGRGGARRERCWTARTSCSIPISWRGILRGSRASPEHRNASPAVCRPALEAFPDSGGAPLGCTGHGRTQRIRASGTCWDVSREG